MNTILTIDEQIASSVEKPGARLAIQRQKTGYTIEYVANKLHLRVRMIELLEADQYDLLPESVFIKGYLRAYARLLEVPADPLLELFNQQHLVEHKIDKALWQSRREPQRAEHAVRWFTGTCAVLVMIAVAFWWQSNKENERFFSRHVARVNPTKNVAENEIRLTDLSKMRSLLSSSGQEALTEKQGV